MAKVARFIAAVIPRTFGLRALLIAVAAISIGLAYEVNWIRERRAFRDANPTVELWHEAADGAGGIIHRRAPSLLWLFGEQGVLGIDIHIPETEVHLDEDGQRVARPNDPVIAKAARLFPEAKAYLSAWTMDGSEQLPICDGVMQTR